MSIWQLNGQRMHHGVAILSRVPLQDPGKHDWQDNGEARHIGVRLECGIRLENVYVPAGGDTPDREINPKFGQKLDFIERMTRWSEKLGEPTIIVGDFNVAPLECDVWSHKALLNVVSHTPVEVEALARLQQAHGWIDIGRKFVPAPERCFTWWSYRSPDWTKNDRGRRLDHMWASPELAGHLVAHRRARAVPQLGAAVGPCAADLRDRGLTPSAGPLLRSARGGRSGSKAPSRSRSLAVETATAETARASSIPSERRDC